MRAKGKRFAEKPSKIKKKAKQNAKEQSNIPKDHSNQILKNYN